MREIKRLAADNDRIRAEIIRPDGQRFGLEPSLSEVDNWCKLFEELKRRSEG